MMVSTDWVSKNFKMDALSWEKKNMEKTIEMADLEGPPCVWKHIETSRNGSVWPGQREECWEQATTLLEAGNVN